MWVGVYLEVGVYLAAQMQIIAIHLIPLLNTEDVFAHPFGDFWFLKAQWEVMRVKYSVFSHFQDEKKKKASQIILADKTY